MTKSDAQERPRKSSYNILKRCFLFWSPFGMLVSCALHCRLWSYFSLCFPYSPRLRWFIYPFCFLSFAFPLHYRCTNLILPCTYLSQVEKNLLLFLFCSPLTEFYEKNLPFFSDNNCASQPTNYMEFLISTQHVYGDLDPWKKLVVVDYLSQTAIPSSFVLGSPRIRPRLRKFLRA